MFSQWEAAATEVKLYDIKKVYVFVEAAFA